MALCHPQWLSGDSRIAQQMQAKNATSPETKSPAFSREEMIMLEIIEKVIPIIAYRPRLSLKKATQKMAVATNSVLTRIDTNLEFAVLSSAIRRRGLNNQPKTMILTGFALFQLSLEI